MSKRRGRPSGETRAREQLIGAAKKLFVSLPYNRVSTRLLATEAGVNAALIRYYFDDKAGLYEAMLRDTLAPMMSKLREACQNPNDVSIEEIIGTYYRIMAPTPALPKLLIRSMMMEEGEAPRQITEPIFNDLIRISQQWLFKSLVASHQLQDGVDPLFARLSFISLTVFPFLAPPLILEKMGVNLELETLAKLASHNGNILKQGMLALSSSGNHFQGDNNEKP